MSRRFGYRTLSGQNAEGVLFSNGTIVLNDPAMGVIAIGDSPAAGGILDRVLFIDHPPPSIESLTEWKRLLGGLPPVGEGKSSQATEVPDA